MDNPDVRESITSVEAVNAAGDSATPMLILPGLYLLEKHFNNTIDGDVLFATSDLGSGYIRSIGYIVATAFREANAP
jgi:hypothetical protein